MEGISGKKLVFSILFGLIAFLFIPTLIDPVSAPRLIGLGVLSLGFFLVPGENKGMSLPPKWLGLAGLTWLGAAFLSLTAALNLSESWVELGRMLSAGLFFLAVLNAFSKKLIDLSSLALVLTLVLLLQGLMGLAQVMGLAFRFESVEQFPSGTFVNKNLYGGMMALLMPWAGLAWLRFSGKLRMLPLLAGAIGLTAIALTGSRGAMLALAAILILSAYLFLGIKQVSKPTWFSGKVLTVLIVIGFTSFFGGILYVIPGKSLTRKAEWISSNPGVEVNEGSIRERVLLWGQSGRMFAQKPLTGVGAGNWKIHILEKGMVSYFNSFGSRYYLRPHNDLLWSLAETGIIGGLSWLTLLILGLILALKPVFNLKDKPIRQEFALLAAGLLGFILLGMVSFPRERPFTFALFLLFLAAAAHLQGSLPRLKSSWPQWLLGAMLIPLIMLWGSRAASEQHIPALMQAQKLSNAAQLVRQADKAESAFYRLESASGTPLPWFRGVGLFLQQDFARAESAFLEAKSLHPWHPHVLNNLASAIEAQGRHAEAQTLYEELLKIFPGFEDAYLNLSAVYFNQGKFAQAKELLLSYEPFETKRKRKEFLDAINSALEKQ